MKNGKSAIENVAEKQRTEKIVYRSLKWTCITLIFMICGYASASPAGFDWIEIVGIVCLSLSAGGLILTKLKLRNK